VSPHYEYKGSTLFFDLLFSVDVLNRREILTWGLVGGNFETMRLEIIKIVKQ
jgi:hypothetical protein